MNQDELIKLKKYKNQNEYFRSIRQKRTKVKKSI